MNDDDLGLRDKVVLITGANNPMGIGAATAVAFADVGAKVFVTYFRIAPATYGLSAQQAQAAPAPGLPLYDALRAHTADAVLQRIQQLGAQGAATELDLSDPRNIPSLFDHVEGALGPVDILVNNAAHYEDPDTSFALSADLVDRTFAVNTRAPVLLSGEYLRRYQQRHATWGRVINLSTDSAQTFVGQIAYGASKAAIEAFTRSMAIEVGPLGITVNTVAPGPVQTGYLSPAAEARLVPQIPLRRLGRPEDIAHAVRFLASTQANWITGQVLKVAGGHAL
jgi:3-oxoacyl-[acyl-carrier protein] reductase